MRDRSPDTCFQFKKRGILVEKPSKMPKPGPYYPCLVEMAGIKDFPFDYALYFSTDHHRGRGGIWLYLCNGVPSEAGNWKSYDHAVRDGDFDYLDSKPRKNPVFVDKIQGRHHTETPHANIVDGKVYMTYHHGGSFGLQPTLLATSSDGINFERVNGPLDSIIIPAKLHGGHTGYFRWAPNPFHGVHWKYIGYSLHGGGDNYHSAMWGSNDAISWKKIHVFTPREGYAMQDENLIMIWHEINPNAVERIGDDEYVLLSAGGNRASGGSARVVKLFEIFLEGDGKTLKRECRQVLPNGKPGDPDSEEAAEPTMVRIGDTWHLIYIGTTNKAKQNTIMAAIGNFNPDAAPSKVLA
ncbi:hypothetical protein GF325_10045 [Candidatus Bathyarchaeota archaeon]|nr:hypothetical protein [Candidatus Bathyarchaeota archaeon]